MTATINSITITPAAAERSPATHYARVPVQKAVLVQQRGIEADQKAKGGVRQINVMRAETMAELAAEGCKTQPGELGEQLVISGLALEQFTQGTQLHIGPDAVIEIGIQRKGCDRFEAIQQRTRQSVAGRLGILARVIRGGSIEVGSEVKVLETAVVKS